MAHKTFISYKYSEARELRDRIIRAMGKDATYYQGETSDSPDLGDYKTSTIKKTLSDMIFDTSVTIVIISPQMKDSKWMDWEIKYSLREKTRNGLTRHANGVVGVIMKYNGAYTWFKCRIPNYIGWETKYHDEKLLPIIRENRNNQKPMQTYNNKTQKELYGSYITFVEEGEFLSCPKFYIDNAYDKSQNKRDEYDIVVNV